MSEYTDTHPTARKRHSCETCGWSIRPGERYRRGVGFDGGTAWTWKECLWCERAGAAYCRDHHDDEYNTDSIAEWLFAEHPATYTAMRAGWRYPDGERLPLPFQPRCIACTCLLDGWGLWCSPCDEARIERNERIGQQLLDARRALA